MEKQIVLVQRGNPETIMIDSKTQKLIELEDADFVLTKSIMSLKESIDLLNISLRNR